MKTDYAIIHKNWNGIEIEIRWNADYVERHLGGPVTKVLLDNCYHMITVDLQYRRVIELSDAFIKNNSSVATARLPEVAHAV